MGEKQTMTHEKLYIFFCKNDCDHGQLNSTFLDKQAPWKGNYCFTDFMWTTYIYLIPHSLEHTQTHTIRLAYISLSLTLHFFRNVSISKWIDWKGNFERARIVSSIANILKFQRDLPVHSIWNETCTNSFITENFWLNWIHANARLFLVSFEFDTELKFRNYISHHNIK